MVVKRAVQFCAWASSMPVRRQLVPPEPVNVPFIQGLFDNKRVALFLIVTQSNVQALVLERPEIDSRAEVIQLPEGR
jgi:hypothetical protein